MTVKDLIGKATKLQEHSDALRGAVRSLQSVEADTTSEFTRLLKGDLRWQEPAHQERVRDALRKELQATRARNCALALYHVESALMEQKPDVQTVRAPAMRAPPLGRVWFALSPRPIVPHASGSTHATPRARPPLYPALGRDGSSHRPRGSGRCSSGLTRLPPRPRPLLNRWRSLFVRRQ